MILFNLILIGVLLMIIAVSASIIYGVLFNHSFLIKHFGFDEEPVREEPYV
jgi:hypothetical protein